MVLMQQETKLTTKGQPKIKYVDPILKAIDYYEILLFLFHFQNHLKFR